MGYRNRALLLVPLTIALATGCARARETNVAPVWLPASPSSLPRWRGFNLIDMFHRDWSNRPFSEDDFRWINELGFNFVRLPMDYRTWIVGDDWEQFDEEALKRIDQAVAWGEQYHLHVMINFHRAPGYTVATPPEARSLWTDPEAQRVCALHWATFARRYRGIPNERLSFNLFNEPAGVEEAAYVEVVKPIVAAIRAADPDRLIVSDGLQYGQHPVLPLIELGIAQATRGYAPGQLTHYKATWVQGADQYPLPRWPLPMASGTLYQPAKPDLAPEALEPLRLAGPFAEATPLRVTVGEVSSRAHLEIRADGAWLWDKEFVNGPGEGEWAEARFDERWNIWVNRWDRDYTVEIPAGTRQVEIQAVAGDWLRLRELAVGDQTLALQPEWNRRPAQVGWADGRLTVAGELGREWLRETMIKPWQAAQAQGLGCMVGEFGSHNQTPHDVVLRWMEDCLANWRDAGWGWALWNFRGAFGILDSNRADVAYEDWRGHQLDRAMLELLQRY